MEKPIVAGLLSLLLTTASAETFHSFVPNQKPFNPSASLTLFQEKKLSHAGLVQAGGYGGNIKTGLLTYDSMPGNLSSFPVFRDIDGYCYMMNDYVHIVDHVTKHTIEFPCGTVDPTHNFIYWSGYLYSNNSGYSPVNDVMYAVGIISRLFNEWYAIPAVIGTHAEREPIKVKLNDNMDNAYISGNKLIIGEGGSKYYPFTSVNAIAYLVGWIFTDQHSNLAMNGSSYNAEGAGIVIAFNSMTAMAAEYYVSGKNTWQVGAEVTKNGQPLYYLDQPSKDCYGKKPGDWCSIDAIWQYNSDVIDYFSSGLYRRAFYLLATSNGWNTHKAYDVFVQANRFHWNGKTTFQSGACDVVTSARELQYDVMSVKLAFAGVGIDTRRCSV